MIGAPFQPENLWSNGPPPDIRPYFWIGGQRPRRAIANNVRLRWRKHLTHTDDRDRRSVDATLANSNGFGR